MLNVTEKEPLPILAGFKPGMRSWRQLLGEAHLVGILVETSCASCLLHPLLHLALFHPLLTLSCLPRFLLSFPICQVSSFGVVTSVGKGQGSTAPPQIPPLGLREPRGQGVKSTRAGPGGPLLGKKTWPELRGRSRGRGCENYSLYCLKLSPAFSLPLL